MKPVELEIENYKQAVYAKDQPEYNPLPCVRLPDGSMATRWLLDDTERDLIWQNGEFYLCISTFNQPLQPLLPMVDKPRVAFDEHNQPFFYSLLQWNEQTGVVEAVPEQVSGLPIGYRDKLLTVSDIHFSFWDKVKILFGWKVELRCNTFVQNVPGKCYSESKVSVYRERNLPQGWGTVESAPREETNVER